eukprot:SAG22_NODE_3494_length_1682_cov_2.278585_3_plen_196_part_00
MEQLGLSTVDAVTVVEFLKDEPQQKAAQKAPPELTGPMEHFDSSEVLRWLATVPGLSSEQRDAVSNEMAADEYEGDDLVTMKTKTLVRMLCGTAGAACIPELLSARDEYVALSRAAITPPHEYMCPISQELMGDPVMTSSGQCYERAEIAKWLEKHQTDPLSNARLEDKKLSAVLPLRQLIAQWREEHPEYGSGV